MDIQEMRVVAYPYPGLRPFEPDEAEIFFGREQHIDDLLVRLQRQRFLGVVGPSGCGKSSLVRAGMIPALQAGLVASAGSGWQVATMRPGSQPLKNLGQALRRSAGPAASADEDGFLDAVLGRGSLGLMEALEEFGLAGDNNLLLVVDQFEELFRFTEHGASSEARAFVDLLLATARAETARYRSSVYIVVTMRSDFLGHCPVFRGLPEALNDSQYLTPRLNREEQRAAIEGPAALFNTTIRPEVVNRILNEMGADPDQLPLMQHLLMRMWRTERRKVPDEGQPIELTTDTYREVGGLHGCLSGHAEQTFQSLRPEEQRIGELLFRQLAEVNPDSRLVRRPRRYGALCGLLAPEERSRERLALASVIDAFRRAGRSFLMPPAAEPLTDSALIDIAHESLIRQWERLKNWIQEEHKRTLVSKIVAVKTTHWIEEGERKDHLLQGVELAEAKAWRDKYPGQLEPEQQRFIAESIKQEEEEVRREEADKYAQKLAAEEIRRKEALKYSKVLEKRNRLLMGLVLFAAALAVFAVWLINSANRAERNKEKAEQEAQRQTEEAQRAGMFLASNYAQSGTRHMNEGKIEEALVWFSEALARDEKSDPQRVDMHRLRLGAALQECSKLVQILPHLNPVNVAEFSPDGSRVVTVSEDGARIWNVSTGRELCQLDHDRSKHASFSPDGRLVVTAGTDIRAVVWDAKTGKRVFPLEHRDQVRWAVFSPDGNRIATGSADRTARVWDAKTGALLSEIETGSADGTGGGSDAKTEVLSSKKRQGGFVYFVAFSPDGSRVVTACADKEKSLCVWDSASGNPVTQPQRNDHYVLSAAFSPKGDRIVTAAMDGAVNVYQIPAVMEGDSFKGPQGLAPQNALRTVDKVFLGPMEFHDMSSAHVSFAADDGTRVLISGASGPELWEVGAKKPPQPAKDCWENNRTISPDGRLRLSWSSPDNSVRIRDDAAGKPKWADLGVGGLVKASFQSSGKVAIAVGKDNIVRVWDPRTGKIQTALAKEEQIVTSAVLSPNGSRILTIHQDKTAQVWDAITGKSVLPLLKEVKFADFSPNSLRLVTATDTSIRAWNIATGAPFPQFEKQVDEPSHAAFDSTSTKIVICGKDKTAYVCEAATGKLLRALSHPSSWVRFAAFSPDGLRVITTSSDRTARIWDLSSQEKPVVCFHNDTVVEASFSRDGSRVLTVSMDKTARIWDSASGLPLTSPLRHKFRLRQAAFSPDDRRVLTETDFDARVWDVTTGEVATPLFKQPDLLDAAFAPDGLSVLTVGADGTCRWWDLAPETRPIEDLVHLAQLLSAYRIDQKGLIPCPADMVMEHWRSLRLKYPRDFFTSPELLAAWHLQEAHDAEKTAQWNVVRLHLDALLAADPAQPELYRRRGLILSKLEQWNEALSDYTNALAAKPDAEICFMRGCAYVRLGKIQEALADFDKALHLDASDGALWLARGIVHGQLDHMKASQDDYEKALLLSPMELPRLDCWWSNRTRNLKQDHLAVWQAVSANCETVCKSGPIAWWALRGHGLALGTLGRWQEAAKSFRKAVDLKPDDWHAWQGAARAYAETGNKWSEAADAATHAIKLRPEDWGCRYLLGIAYAQRSRYPEAIEAYSEAIKLGAKGWGILAQRGYARGAAKQHDGAIADYSAVIREYPHYAPYNNRAISYVNKGDYKKALEDCLEGIRLSPNVAIIRRTVGNLYHRMGDDDKAVAEYDAAIRFGPASETAAALLVRGDVYLRRDMHDRAVKDYTKYLEHNQLNPYAYGQLGRAYTKLPDYDRAILSYSEGIRLNFNAQRYSNNASFYNGRGYAYHKKGEPKKAIDDYLQALDIDPLMMAATCNLANLMIKGATQQVEQVYRDKIASKEKRFKDNPSFLNQQGLAKVHENLAVLHQLTGRLYDAESACRRALALQKEITKANSRDMFRQVRLAQCYDTMGTILAENKKANEAEDAYQDALDIRTRMVEDFPPLPDCFNELARALATCPAEQLRDPQEAVKLAKKAVDLAPLDWHYRNTLGVALYRAGEWQDAVKALERSMGLASEDIVIDWLFLAMAHQRLGNREKARQWYDRAVADMDKSAMMDTSRRLFRQEAAALLGLPAAAAKSKQAAR